MSIIGKKIVFKYHDLEHKKGIVLDSILNAGNTMYIVSYDEKSIEKFPVYTKLCIIPPVLIVEIHS